MPLSVLSKANFSLEPGIFKYQSTATGRGNGGWKIFGSEFSHLNACKTTTCFKFLSTHFKSMILWVLGLAVAFYSPKLGFQAV